MAARAALDAPDLSAASRSGNRVAANGRGAAPKDLIAGLDAPAPGLGAHAPSPDAHAASPDARAQDDQAQDFLEDLAGSNLTSVSLGPFLAGEGTPH